MKTIDPQHTSYDRASQMRVTVFVVRHDEMITERLLKGALDALADTGVPEGNITVVRVPDLHALLIPVKTVLKEKKADACVALACDIGRTEHKQGRFDTAEKLLAELSLQYDIPVIPGFVLAKTVEDAVNCAGERVTNAGYGAAVSAMKCLQIGEILA